MKATTAKLSEMCRHNATAFAMACLPPDPKLAAEGAIAKVIGPRTGEFIEWQVSSDSKNRS